VDENRGLIKILGGRKTKRKRETIVPGGIGDLDHHHRGGRRGVGSQGAAGGRWGGGEAAQRKGGITPRAEAKQDDGGKVSRNIAGKRGQRREGTSYKCKKIPPKLRERDHRFLAGAG